MTNRNLWKCESAFRPKVSVFRNRRVFRKRRLIRVSSCEVGYEAGFLQKVLTVNILHYILFTITAMDRRKANGNNKITDRRISSGLCQ